MNNNRSYLQLGLCIFSWTLLAFAFPPFPLGAGALVFLAPWFFVLQTATKKVALISTYIGAFIFNAINIYWLYHVGAVAPLPIILLGLFLGVSFLSLYALLSGWVFLSLKSLGAKTIILFPLFWAAVEVSRAKGDMSFPWLSLGVAFGGDLRLMQGVAVVGVFGYSALIIFSNMVLAKAFLERRWKFALIPLIIACFLYGFGSLSLFIKENDHYTLEMENSTTLRKGIRVAIIQPSIHQTQKWSKTYYDSVMTKTWKLFESLNPDSVDLILFPETAIPDFISARWREQEFLLDYAEKNGVSIVIGALNRLPPPPKSPKKHIFYNSAFLFSPDRSVSEYRKMHLVPFSERLPFDDVIPLLNFVDLGEGDFSAGDSVSVWKPSDFAPLICYEAIYGNILRDAKRKGAKFIANITNDGWFMRSSAPYQHFNLVRIHAVESGIGVARSANTGISAFIDADGRVFGQTELFDETFIVKEVPLLTRNTIYSYLGDSVEWLLLFFGVSVLAFIVIRKRLS